MVMNDLGVASEMLWCCQSVGCDGHGDETVRRRRDDRIEEESVDGHAAEGDKRLTMGQLFLAVGLDTTWH